MTRTLNTPLIVCLALIGPTALATNEPPSNPQQDAIAYGFAAAKQEFGAVLHYQPLLDLCGEALIAAKLPAATDVRVVVDETLTKVRDRDLPEIDVEAVAGQVMTSVTAYVLGYRDAMVDAMGRMTQEQRSALCAAAKNQSLALIKAREADSKP